MENLHNDIYSSVTSSTHFNTRWFTSIYKYTSCDLIYIKVDWKQQKCCLPWKRKYFFNPVSFSWEQSSLSSNFRACWPHLSIHHFTQIGAISSVSFHLNRSESEQGSISCVLQSHAGAWLNEVYVSFTALCTIVTQLLVNSYEWGV